MQTIAPYAYGPDYLASVPKHTPAPVAFAAPADYRSIYDAPIVVPPVAPQPVAATPVAVRADRAERLQTEAVWAASYAKRFHGFLLYMTQVPLTIHPAHYVDARETHRSLVARSIRISRASDRACRLSRVTANR